MKNYFLAFITFAAFVLAACSGTTKGGTETIPEENENAAVEVPAARDSITPDQATDVVEDLEVAEPTANPEVKEAEKVKPKSAETAVAEETQNTPKASADEDKPSLFGVWAMKIADTYDTDNKKTECSTTESAVWEFTEKTVTVYEEDDLNDGQPLSYTLSGNVIKAKDVPFTFTIVKLTATTLVLRSSVYNDSYKIFTFSRV